MISEEEYKKRYKHVLEQSEPKELTLEKFIDLFCVLDVQDNGEWGHYPFHLYAELKSGHGVVNGMALSGIEEVCKRISHYRQDDDVIRIFASIDFPPKEDIKYDFIGIFSIDKKYVQVQAIPYDKDTGEMFERTTKPQILRKIKQMIHETT